MTFQQQRDEQYNRFSKNVKGTECKFDWMSPLNQKFYDVYKSFELDSPQGRINKAFAVTDDCKNFSIKIRKMEDDLKAAEELELYQKCLATNLSFSEDKNNCDYFRKKAEDLSIKGIANEALQNCLTKYPNIGCGLYSVNDNIYIQSNLSKFKWTIIILAVMSIVILVGIVLILIKIIMKKKNK